MTELHVLGFDINGECSNVAYDLVFFHDSTAPSLLTFRNNTKLVTPFTLGLLWKNDQLVAETFTCQHTTLTTDIHSPGGIRTRNPKKRGRRPLPLTAHPPGSAFLLLGT